MKRNTFVQRLVVVVGLVATSAAFAASADLKSAQGTVLIAAPTALNGPTHQGIWFVSAATKSLSLELPELANNEVYEGWIVDDSTGKKISTGIFRANGLIDSDSAGRYAGPLALNFPPVPGSDFVTLGHDLADGGHRIVITVEPYPDSNPSASGVGVLAVTIPSGTSVGTELTLENIAQ